MKCRLEALSRQLDILVSIREGYWTGSFSDLFPRLADDCILESMWVLTPLIGKDAVTSYFERKGDTLRNSNSSLRIYKAELTDDGEFCLIINQKLDDTTNSILIRAELDDSGMVKRITLNMPELFKYEGFEELYSLSPTVDGTDNDEHLVYISQLYYPDLNTFLLCAGSYLDPYGEMRIPMEQWRDSLKYWHRFVSARDYDEAFESIAGIDYEKGTVQKPAVAKHLGTVGQKLWNSRSSCRRILKDLWQWTNLIKNDYSFINTYGW